MTGATNLYRRLRELLPEPALLVATVTSVHGDGTSTVTLPAGGTLRVRGTSVSAGQLAFVRDGVIEGQAPALSVVLIEI